MKNHRKRRRPFEGMTSEEVDAEIAAAEEEAEELPDAEQVIRHAETLPRDEAERYVHGEMLRYLQRIRKRLNDIGALKQIQKKNTDSAI